MNFLPKKMRRYFRAKFQSDLYAGLTVAMVVIPQGMAYAAIAGINPIYGLFTAIFPTIIGAIFGSFPFLITGPTNPTALVTANVLMSQTNQPNYLEYVIALAIVAGIFKLVFGLLKLGTLAKYISNSVLVGFLTGVGILIVTTQLGNLLGFKLPSDGSLFEIILQAFKKISDINPYAAIIGGMSIGLMILVRKFNRKLPAALITIILSTLFVMATGWSDTQGVSLVSLPERLGFRFHIPEIYLKEYVSLGFSGAAVALFGFMETISISKSMSQMTGDSLDPSREMVGQGLASFVGGFFQCMPSAGSPSRTVINVVNGAKTRFSAIISGISVAVFLLLFSKLIRFIPIPALAAIVIVSSVGLINIHLIKITWQSRLQSRVVMAITLISTLVLPLEYAIYLGILSTILIYLGESSHMNLSYIIENENGQFVELPLEGILKEKPVVAIVNIEGDLYFAAVDDLQNQVEQVLETDIKVLILRFRRTHLLASTGAMAIEQIIRTARKKNIHVLFCGVKKEILDPLEAAGVVAIVGDTLIFPAKIQLFESTHLALKEARTLLEKEKSREESAS